ncbi:MAG: hypothetical protein ACW98Y_21895 [Candidatus Thorarchaeota archaeon]|jgi:hypothetical protein
MSTKKLLSRVQKIVDSMEKGKTDPLDVQLTDAYVELREAAAEVDSRLDIDAMLNDILDSKVTRVQELAKVLAAPELYVDRLKAIKPRNLSKLIVYKQPVKMTRLGHEGLARSLERISQHIDAMSQLPVDDPIPEMSGVPDDYTFASQDSVFLADLEKFAKKVPKNKTVAIEKIIATDDFELFLKRFLYIVILISRGRLEYFPETQTIRKPE